MSPLKPSRTEQVKNFGEALHAVPNDAWAILIAAMGLVLILTHHDEPGKELLFAAATIFKGSIKQ